MQKLKYSTSPHIRSPLSTRRIMIDVCIAMLPVCIMGCVLFGWNALWIIITASVSAVLAEVVYRLIARVPFKQIMQEFDFTSLVTGMLLGVNMPAFNYAQGWYVPILASMFSIIIAKMIFGGTGRNLVNPAIVGRIFAVLSFTRVMTQWVQPNLPAFSNEIIPAGATPLSQMLSQSSYTAVHSMGLSNLDLFLGTGIQGVIGETCKVALLLGGIYLVIRSVIDIRLPLVYIGMTGLVTVIINGFNFYYFLPSILSGGLFLGAIFMSTDYVTTPNTKVGNYLYFALLGILTALLRKATGMEVVSFVILFMNLLVPLIDKFIVNKPFGTQKKVNSNKEVAKQ
ncbi:MAG: RnfABCDGE type electron transport complex subunit D [Clostridia bacterium]|nr:RnfABCDGE type electron transport complex subunit D [Clostridia bacterium]